jgi:hypothetical protein
MDLAVAGASDMALNIYQSPDQTLMLMQKQWASQLNPLLANIFPQGSLLTNVKLINGASTFNHYLGSQMTGWVLADQNAAASIYRSAPLNSQTLTLTSNAVVTVSLWVF